MRRATNNPDKNRAAQIFTLVRMSLSKRANCASTPLRKRERGEGSPSLDTSHTLEGRESGEHVSLRSGRSAQPHH